MHMLGRPDLAFKVDIQDIYMLVLHKIAAATLTIHNISQAAFIATTERVTLHHLQPPLADLMPGSEG